LSWRPTLLVYTDIEETTQPDDAWRTYRPRTVHCALVWRIPLWVGRVLRFLCPRENTLESKRDQLYYS
jgi:hypothetical protein